MKGLMYFIGAVLVIGMVACTKGDKSNNKNTTESENNITDENEDPSWDLYAINASQHGVNYRETMILLQNRCGLRIEFCVDRGALQIWISPQAGKSLSYVDRNWSTRDDHTNVFDRILIPGLNLKEFDSCHWDPFHSIVYFKNQTLHLSQVYDQPVVLLWMEQPGEVDFKILGEEVERASKAFVINHTDRGRAFQSAAVLSKGEGNFTHQLVLDQARSIYARAHLKPGQFIAIASELKAESIAKVAKSVAQTDLQEILKLNDSKISRDISTGLFQLNGRSDMQELLNVSRRYTLSMQDFNGLMRSTNNYIYYLLWWRDGGMNTSHLCYSGWSEPARQNTMVALANPNTSLQEPKGIFYGMTMSGPITKFEEDGLFYVLWQSFSYWTQTGDKTYCSGENLKKYEQAMQWLERYIYDEKQGLFGRYFYCETPYPGSRDNGFDNATGAPTYTAEAKYKGNNIVRAFDLYINILAYSSYYMLASMENEAAAADYIKKAKNIEKNMKVFFDYEGGKPSYGYLLTDSGKMLLSEPYGMDIWDYVWGLSLPPFTPTLPNQYKAARNLLYKDMVGTRNVYFLCTYNGLLTSMDSEIHGEEQLLAALDSITPVSIKPGKYFPFKNAVPEVINTSEENPYHDIRPLVYSIAPWMSAVTNLAIRRLPFGIAARPSQGLKKIDNYTYREGLIDIELEGKGSIVGLEFNNIPLLHTWQLPINMVKKGDNGLKIKMGNGSEGENILIGSTVELQSVVVQGADIKFLLKTYGKNVLTFKNLSRSVKITDTSGVEIPSVSQKMDQLTYIEFEGIGNYSVLLK